MKEPQKPHYTGHRQRLKERLVRDSRSLADYEVLELVLALCVPRKDTKPMAKALIERYGSLKDVITAHPDKIAEAKGLGVSANALWSLLQELHARLGETDARSGKPLTYPTDVAEAAMARIGNKSLEEFWVAFLDSKNRVIAWEQVSKGTVNATPVFPREILAAALKMDAAKIILAHNHPGGDPAPSKEDILLTGSIIETAERLDVEVVDHIIVADMDYYSFNEQGRI